MKASAGSSTGTTRPAPPISAGPWPDHFRLTGPSRLPDPRIHAYRRDIADVALAGALFAPHYARAVTCHVISDAAMLRAEPSEAARATSQLLRGEGFALLDLSGDWAWGRCLHDDYVGYLPCAALDVIAEPDQRVSVPRALIFAEPDIKAPAIGAWTMGARFQAVAEGRFLAVEGGYIHVRHAEPLTTISPDYVAVGAQMIGQPYLWGGRGAGGIDCSGLVQLALSFAGIDAPRDSDMQRALGDSIAIDGPLRRGDLVFFPGHVGLMTDDENLLHANAYWMATVVEPLADVVARLRPDYAEPIIAVKRPA